MTPPPTDFSPLLFRGQGSFGINTAGQREDTTNWLVNGINLNDNVQNQITFSPPSILLLNTRSTTHPFPPNMAATRALS